MPLSRPRTAGYSSPFEATARGESERWVSLTRIETESSAQREQASRIIH